MQRSVVGARTQDLYQDNSCKVWTNKRNSRDHASQKPKHHQRYNSEESLPTKNVRLVDNDGCLQQKQLNIRIKQERKNAKVRLPSYSAYLSAQNKPHNF